MKFCIECGKKLSDGAKFCAGCGTKVVGTTALKATTSCRVVDADEEQNMDVAEVKALCMKLIDIPNEGIHLDNLTKDLVNVIKKSADLGVGISAYVMGQFYGSGLKIKGETIVPEDADKMLECLRKGAEAGDHFAQGCYGNELCNGVEGSTDHEDGDDETGFPWIVKAGKNGNVLALHRMTWAYLDGSYGQTPDLRKALECFRASVAAQDAYDWKEEWIERAQGYLKFLPAVIDGDIGAMRKLGEWLKEHEGDWEYSWGIGDSSEESTYWLKKANDAGDSDEADDEDDIDEADEADDEEDEEEIDEDDD